MTAPSSLPLWPGAAPGSEDWTHEEGGYVEHREGFPPMPVVTGVRTPSVELRRAPPGPHADTLVLVCPGGGFQLLAMEHEGALVAERLLAGGVSTAILRYRTEPPGARDLADLHRDVEANGFDAAVRALSSARGMAAADALRALEVLDAQAAAEGRPWRRVGLLGFSAGAALALHAATGARTGRELAFVAALYGWLDDDAPVTASSPPLFLATAADDRQVPAERSLRAFRRWTEAGARAELHVYEGGGHGFGAIDRGLPADAWSDAFLRWLTAGGRG